MTAPEASMTGPPTGVTWSSVLSGKSPTSKSKSPLVKAINGTIYVKILKEVLLESLPLWKTYVVGHFIGDSAPHIGKVHATVNRLWTDPNSKVKIDANFINTKTVLFKIESDTIRSRVLRRQFWHISDIPMVVREWSPSTADAEPDLTAIPLWVDFANVPAHLFSRRGLMFLGDSIGVAQRLHPNTEKCMRFDVARVLVEVNLTMELPEKISLGSETKLVEISYPWLPPRCSKCNKWGHQMTDCSQMTKETDTTEMGLSSETEQASKENTPALNTNSSSENLTQQSGKEQRRNQEPADEVLEVQSEHQFGQVNEGPPGDAALKQLPNLNQSQEQVPSDEMQNQVFTPAPSPPKPTPEKENNTEQQATSLLKEQRPEMDSEEGEIQLESITPTESDDENNALQDQKMKQGGGYQLRNPPKEPSTKIKESKKANRKNQNIKSSSRKA